MARVVLKERPANNKTSLKVAQNVMQGPMRGK